MTNISRRPWSCASEIFYRLNKLSATFRIRFSIRLISKTRQITTPTIAFQMWINGDSFNADTVRQFILWSVNKVPHFLWKKFCAGWYDVLHQMMKAPELFALEADL